MINLSSSHLVMLIVFARASCRKMPSSKRRKLVLILIKMQNKTKNSGFKPLLEEDFIWTVSDCSEDPREVDSERISLWFLSQSVQATQKKLWENTVLVISEAKFRKILRLSKHKKTYGKQNIKTALAGGVASTVIFSRHLKSAVRKILKHVKFAMISVL